MVYTSQRLQDTPTTKTGKRDVKWSLDAQRGSSERNEVMRDGAEERLVEEAGTVTSSPPGSVYSEFGLMKRLRRAFAGTFGTDVYGRT